MINAKMRQYIYYKYGDKNSYGQQTLIGNGQAQGSIEMAINVTSQSVQDNINYSGATYLGLTFAPIDDSYVIQYDNKKLKVLYVNPQGRLTQVFMSEI